MMFSTNINIIVCVISNPLFFAHFLFYLILLSLAPNVQESYKICYCLIMVADILKTEIRSIIVLQLSYFMESSNKGCKKLYWEMFTRSALLGPLYTLLKQVWIFVNTLLLGWHCLSLLILGLNFRHRQVFSCICKFVVCGWSSISTVAVGKSTWSLVWPNADHQIAFPNICISEWLSSNCVYYRT